MKIPLGLYLSPGQARQYRAELLELNPDWVHLDLIWADVEQEKGIYQWSPIFDEDLAIISEMGCEPLVILKMAPRWARTEDRECSRIKPACINKFARFASQCAARYPQVRYWEIWNEADSKDGAGKNYGCWGNPAEKFYGGAYYASVFKPVKKAIKKANKKARVYFGGLMMLGTDQLYYLQGALEAGTKPDGISLHHYCWFKEGPTSPDLQIDMIRQWTKKPIILSETSMLYDRDRIDPICEQAQADYLLSITEWAETNKLQAVIWYGLSEQWRHCSLIEDGRKKPVFNAFVRYQQ